MHPSAAKPKARASPSCGQKLSSTSPTNATTTANLADHGQKLAFSRWSRTRASAYSSGDIRFPAQASARDSRSLSQAKKRFRAGAAMDRSVPEGPERVRRGDEPSVGPTKRDYICLKRWE